MQAEPQKISKKKKRPKKDKKMTRNSIFKQPEKTLLKKNNQPKKTLFLNLAEEVCKKYDLPNSYINGGK